MAGVPGFLLGVASSSLIEEGQPIAVGLSTVDAQGSVYLVGIGSLEKFTADGALVWTASLGTFAVGAMAVDSSGNVYAVSFPQDFGPLVTMKVNANGSLSPSSATFGMGLKPLGITVDASGRVWIIGNTTPGVANPLATTPGAYQSTLPNITSSHAFVARLNTAGTALDYATYLAGSAQDYPEAIGVDSSGAAIITGWTLSSDFPLTSPGSVPSTTGAYFLTRLTPAGSGLLYSVIVAPGSGGVALAVGANGEAAVDYAYSPTLAYFSPQGVLIFSKSGEGGLLAVDAAGNVYASSGSAGNHTVQNSIAPCGSVYLDVFSPTGELLQATWLPNSVAIQQNALAIALGPNSAVYLLTLASYQDAGAFWLTEFAPNPSAQSLALACLTDAALFTAPNTPFSLSGTTAGIAPGEIVSLFGEGLGPSEGVQPQVTLQTGYPEQLSGVQVLFDGQPAPLLYVQNQQINAVVPWELSAGSTTNVCVSYGGTVTNCLTEPVVQAAPAVFTIDGVHAAALNQDGTINSLSHPAPVGSIISIFATGLGPMTPAAADGVIVVPPLPANTLGVQAWAYVPVNGVPYAVSLAVTYAGPAPFEVAGLSQINFQIPEQFASLNPDAYISVGNARGYFYVYVD